MTRVSLAATLVVSSLVLAAGPASNKPPLTREAYKKLVLGLADCKVVGYDIDGKCAGVKALQDAIKETNTPLKDLAGMNEGLGRELLGHASPAIRIKGANLTSSVLGTGTASQDAIVAAGAKEKDPGVLQAFIRVVSSSGAKNPKVAAFLIKSADHSDMKVRLQAVYALSSAWNREMAGGAEKLLSMAQKDAEVDVRKAACEYGGKLGNPVLLPFMEKATEKTDDKVMYTACMKGLLTMFYDYPLFGTSNEAAYKLFLKRMAEKPRSSVRPPWTLTGAFEKYTSQTTSGFTDWKKAASWFKPADVQKVLIDILKDKDAYLMGRRGAVGSLVGLGSTGAELEALKASLDPKNSNDQSVSKEIDAAIAKMK